jgi:AAA domain
MAKSRPDANETLRIEGPEGVRARHAKAKRYNGTGSAPNPFKLVALDDVQIDDDPVHLIEGLLPAGPALHVMYGPPKSLKSFGLMHAYMSIAAGLDYAGRRVLPGAVAYVTNEGIRGVNRRLVAMRRHLAIEGQGVPFYLVPAMPDLGNGTGDAEKLIAAIAAKVPAGIALRAVAIDTVRRATPGKDENSTKDMSMFIANCGLIAEKFGCLTSGVHHSPRSDDGRTAGSNSLDGAMDCGWSVSRDGDQATITVKIMKDGTEGDSWSFSLHPKEIGITTDGRPIIGCSVDIDRVPTSEPVPKPTKVGMTKSAQIALRALHEAIDELGIVPPASNHIPEKVKTVSIDQWRQYAYRRGISNSEEDRAKQQAFKRAYEHLIGSERARVWDGQVWPT